MRRLLGRVTVVLGMVGALLAVSGEMGADAAPGCGALDRPETGVPGDVPLADQLSGRADEGYNCGLSLVGYSSLGARGGNANMAWVGDCAYVSGDGVAVVDVSDPYRPQHISTLRGPGSNASVETLHAVEAPDRSILVTGRYGLFGINGMGSDSPVDVWDVSDCRHPVRLSTFYFPWNAHNLTLSADGKTVWNTLPLQAMDITDPAKPRFLGNLEDELRASGDVKLLYAHEVWPSPDGRRIYIGGQMAGDEELMVVDVEGWPERPARIIGRTPSPGHSIRPATIDGRPYLVNSDESILNLTAKGCLPEELTPVGSASQPYLTDISDETNPVVRGKFRLPINEPANCLSQVTSLVNASVHYQDVDDPDDTTFVMASMWNAGLRLIDVRDPANPREVAYFNPGRFQLADASGGTPIGLFNSFNNPTGLDMAWGHVRYRPETGHIWLATASGGFWVLEIQPQVRAALDLPSLPTVHPDGAPPRPAATRIQVGLGNVSSLYCILDRAI